MIRVSVVTPTYERHDLLVGLFECFKQQTFPSGMRELIVLDDSSVPYSGLIPDGVRYVYSSVRSTVGEKRNTLSSLATGEIVVCFDDDDYYPPERIQHAVDCLAPGGSELAGSSALDVYFTDLDEAYRFGPYGVHHATAATMAFTKRYAETHSFDPLVRKGEERQFTNNYTVPLVQLQPEWTVLAINRPGRNTVDKHDLIRSGFKVDYAKLYPSFRREYSSLRVVASDVDGLVEP